MPRRTSRGGTGRRRRSHAATDVTNRSPYSAVPRTSCCSAGTRRERVHVVEGAARRQESSVSGEPGARSAPRSSRCAAASARRPSKSPSSGGPRRASSPRPLAPPSSSEESNSSCMPRQMPSSGVPASNALEQQLVQPSSRRFASPAGTPRRRARPARRRPAARVIAADARPRADVLERLLDRAAVAHPVVDDRDVTGSSISEPPRRSSGERPLRARHAASRSGRSRPPARSARANALNAASIMWWALRAAPRRVRCSVSLAALASARKNSSVSSWSKLPVAPGGSSASNSVNGRARRCRSRTLARASSIGTVA